MLQILMATIASVHRATVPGVTIDGVIMACQDNFKDDGATVAAANDMQFATLTAGVVTDPTATADTGLVLLEGSQPTLFCGSGQRPRG